MNTVALILLLFFTVLTAGGAERRALVVGIGEYQSAEWSNIHGDSDVPLIVRFLSERGFTDIGTLVNEEATKKGIIASFRAMETKCRPGDIVYVHFSGHGQQITDLDGDEDDGFDEAWIPYDAGMSYSETYKGENHLTDDEIGYWLERICRRIGSSGKLLVVADACHSGDSTRGDVAGVCLRGTDKDFIIPQERKPERIAKKTEKWLMLTACRDYQVNCELRLDNGTYCGMLTYALSTLDRKGLSAANGDILRRIQNFVDDHRTHLPQNPTISGNPRIRISHFFSRR